ncbi:helix-turn-helix domain-containing protein [Halorussus halophilus]|uniref:helix-turn-helix domain-containing protein n=1 Tax=Halorussus halophilus TaxID=2650975 RepID=UPI001CE425CD|nr:helix-turn-helix domain-containing protein [Halorussus halophilus]
MNYLTLTLHQPRETRHPMQNFIADSDAVAREELLSWNILHEESVEYLLFFVDGEIVPYREAISEIESVPEYTLVPIDDSSFYAYVVQETRDEDVRFRTAFARRRLLVVPPIEYTGEGHMRFTVIGDPEDMRSLVNAMPDSITAEIEEVGEYDHRHGTVAGALTDRQFEAVTAAKEVGYYEVPREGSLSEVAEKLGCAESTASNLLRKAESRVMSELVAGR